MVCWYGSITSVSVSDGSGVNRLWQEWERFTRENAAVKKKQRCTEKKKNKVPG